MQDLHLTNNWLALIFPWVSGGQVFGILLCRTFLSNQPAALFESARMDGATELAAYYKIALPLAKPILATLAIMNLMGFYNDFIWPLMVIDNNSRQVITVAIRVFQSMTGSIDLGSMVAGFVFSLIPLLILFMFGSRLYIEGVTSGAIKT
jgi:ABC-type glycerol-3-phosphate transport system permease component